MPRQPVPESTLAARKAWAAKKKAKVTAASPPPMESAPEMPVWLSPAGAEYWPRLIAQLIAGKQVQAVDTEAVGLLCERIAQYVALRAEATMNVHITPSGERTHPLVKLRDEAFRDIQSLCRELGMTPIGRKGLAAPQVDKPKAGQIIGMKR